VHVFLPQVLSQAYKKALQCIVSYNALLRMHVSQSMAAMGAGDLLMSFLGVVIISMGFR
jgi:hypothetical protein